MVVTKSTVTEEIALNDILEANGCEVAETDLVDCILQIDDRDPPSDIVAPGLTKIKNRCARIPGTRKERFRDWFKNREKGVSNDG